MTRQPMQRCPFCDAKMVEYRHCLSGALVGALVKFYQTAGLRPLNLKHAGLTRNQWDNFQKLRYWGLVAKSFDKAGVWYITPLGEAFVFQETTVQKYAWTYRGEWLRYEGPEVDVESATGGYLLREDYINEAQPHD